MNYWQPYRPVASAAAGCAMATMMDVQGTPRNLSISDEKEGLPLPNGESQKNSEGQKQPVAGHVEGQPNKGSLTFKDVESMMNVSELLSDPRKKSVSTDVIGMSKFGSVRLQELQEKHIRNKKENDFPKELWVLIRCLLLQSVN